MQRKQRGLDEKRHETELDAMLLFKSILIVIAQLNHWQHIHFIKGSKNCGILLRLQQAFGDTLTDTSHWHALFHTPTRCRLRNRGSWHSRFCLHRNQHIFLDDSPATSATANRSSVNFIFCRDLLRRRHHGSLLLGRHIWLRGAAHIRFGIGIQ